MYTTLACNCALGGAALTLFSKDSARISSLGENSSLLLFPKQHSLQGMEHFFTGDVLPVFEAAKWHCLHAVMKIHPWGVVCWHNELLLIYIVWLLPKALIILELRRTFYMGNDEAKHLVVWFWLLYINYDLFTLFYSNLSFSQQKMNILKSVSLINMAGGLINLLLQQSWERRNSWNCLLPETFSFFSCLPFFKYVAPAFQKYFFLATDHLKQRKILKILSMCEYSPSKFIFLAVFTKAIALQGWCKNIHEDLQTFLTCAFPDK